MRSTGQAAAAALAQQCKVRAQFVQATDTSQVKVIVATSGQAPEFQRNGLENLALLTRLVAVSVPLRP